MTRVRLSPKKEGGGSNLKQTNKANSSYLAILSCRNAKEPPDDNRPRASWRSKDFDAQHCRTRPLDGDVTYPCSLLTAPIFYH